MNAKIISYGSHSIDTSDIKSVNKTLLSKWLSQGPKSKLFEKKLSNYFQSKYSLVVSNGTVALYLAGRALGWNKDSTILMSPLTFVAGANAAELCSSKILFADIDRNNYCIDPNKVEDQIKKTKKKINTVIATDYAGHACDWKSLKYLSYKYGFYLINDNCHAFGTKYLGSKHYASKYADLSCLSFHPVKHITTGEGGAIITNNKNFYNKLIILRENGILRKKNKWFDYDVVVPSLNFRMSDIQASLGISQLKRINLFISYRKKIAKIYNSKLKNIESLVLPSILNTSHSYHLYPLLIDFKKLKIKKEKFIFQMYKKFKIKLQVHYKPIFCFDYYKKKYQFKKKDLKKSYQFFENSISLPIYFGLKHKEQMRVINAIKKIIKQ